MMNRHKGMPIVFSVSTLFAILCCLLDGFGEAEGAAAEHEHRLLREVILKNEPSVRPVEDLSEPVNVSLDITFNNIIDVNEKHQILISSVWVRQTWITRTTRWNPADYGGLKEVVISSSKVWQPDTVLYNNIFEEFNGRLDATVTRVRIYSNGFVYWATPFIFKTLCKIDVSDFPFDKQKCNITFGAWQYDGNEVNVTNTKKIATMAKTRVVNGEWTVEKVAIERRIIYYQCCPNQPYPEVAFVIHMKRRALFYVVNLVLPNFLITLLAFFSFYIPVECGERISFVITVLLSMTVFLLLVAESIPPTSEAVPVIGIYYAFSIVEVFMALIATGISLKINYSYLFGDGLSPKLKSLLFKTIGPLLGFEVKKILTPEYMDYAREKNTSSSYCCVKHSEDATTEDERETFCKAGKRKLFSRDSLQPNGTKHLRDITSLENDTFDGNGKEENPNGHNVCIRRHETEMIKTVMFNNQESDRKTTESKLAAAVVDKAFFLCFNALFVISTGLILGLPFMKAL